MLVLPDLIDMRVQKCAFFRHFSSLQFCCSPFCLKCCDGWHLFSPEFVYKDCFSLRSFQMEVRNKGAGKNKKKGMEAEGPDNLAKRSRKKNCLIPLESLACSVYVCNCILAETGELLKGFQRVQHSEAALWCPGTWKRKLTKLNPVHFFFFNIEF